MINLATRHRVLKQALKQAHLRLRFLEQTLCLDLAHWQKEVLVEMEVVQMLKAARVKVDMVDLALVGREALVVGTSSEAAIMSPLT